MAKTPRPRTSEERQIARDKAARAEKFVRLAGGMDASEKQWGMMYHQLGQCSRYQVITYVAWANGVYPAAATLDRFDKRKTFLSRIFWIRAINMALHGFSECGSEAELLAAASGLTEEEWLSSFEMDDLFDDLPPMPQ